MEFPNKDKASTHHSSEEESNNSEEEEPPFCTTETTLFTVFLGFIQGLLEVQPSNESRLESCCRPNPSNTPFPSLTPQQAKECQQSTVTYEPQSSTQYQLQEIQVQTDQTLVQAPSLRKPNLDKRHKEREEKRQPRNFQKCRNEKKTPPKLRPLCVCGHGAPIGDIAIMLDVDGRPLKPYPVSAYHKCRLLPPSRDSRTPANNDRERKPQRKGGDEKKKHVRHLFPLCHCGYGVPRGDIAIKLDVDGRPLKPYPVSRGHKCRLSSSRQDPQAPANNDKDRDRKRKPQRKKHITPARSPKVKKCHPPKKVAIPEIKNQQPPKLRSPAPHIGTKERKREKDRGKNTMDTEKSGIYDQIFRVALSIRKLAGIKFKEQAQRTANLRRMEKDKRHGKIEQIRRNQKENQGVQKKVTVAKLHDKNKSQDSSTASSDEYSYSSESEYYL